MDESSKVKSFCSGNTDSLQTSFMTMWSSYKPIKNNYFWVGVIFLMLAVVYGFWWVTDNLNVQSDALLTASTTQILRDTEALKH